MIADHEWLDLRVPFDDAARQQSLPLLDRVVAALRDEATGSPGAVGTRGHRPGGTECCGVTAARSGDRRQQRHGKLGPAAPETLADLAHKAGASVSTSVSQWQLTAPQDQAFLTRFLTERVQAAVEHQPELRSLATEWLHRRLDQAAKELKVEVEHLDVVVDARTRR